jgi:hypothetical protein
MSEQRRGHCRPYDSDHSAQNINVFFGSDNILVHYLIRAHCEPVTYTTSESCQELKDALLMMQVQEAAGCQNGIL